MKLEPKFLSSTCPTSGRVFLLRTRNPAFLAEIHTFHSMPETVEFELNIPIGARCCDNGVYYVLRPVRFFDVLPPASTQAEADELARIMRRAIDWYLQAIIKKNNNHD